MRILFFICGLWASSVYPVTASANELIGSFDDWYAYQASEDGKPVCFMASEPTKSEGNYTRRGDIFLMVAHRPQDQEVGIISFTAGYTYRQGSAPNAVIGDQGFALFTQGENAFAEPGDDPKMVQAMIRGANLVIKGTSSRGTLTTDTYSLKGFTKAYQAISQACGVN